MQSTYFKINSFSKSLESDTPEKKKFRDLMDIVSSVVWDVEWNEDYSKIDEVFNFIKGCEPSE